MTATFDHPEPACVVRFPIRPQRGAIAVITQNPAQRLGLALDPPIIAPTATRAACAT